MLAPHRRLSMRGLLRSRPRLYTSLLLGILVTAFAPQTLKLPVRFLLGWDSTVSLYLMFAFMMMARATQRTMRRRAIQHRDGRWVILTLMALAAGASLFAIGQILGAVKGMSPIEVELHMMLAGFTIVGS